MLLGGYIVGFLFLLHEQNIADNTNVMDTLAEIGVALVWFLPKGYLFIKWILGLFKGKAALFALMVLPAMAMAGDDKYKILGEGLWLIPAIVVGVLCYTIPYGYKVWKAGTERFNDRPGETGKRVKIHVSDRTPLKQNIAWIVSIVLILGLIIFFWVQLNAR